MLEKARYDIKFIGTECPSVSDRQVMEMAIREYRTIITFDRDYGELIYKYSWKPKSGVIYLRFDNFPPIEPGEYLLSIFEASSVEFENIFTVIDRINIRQRKY